MSRIQQGRMLLAEDYHGFDKQGGKTQQSKRTRISGKDAANIHSSDKHFLGAVNLLYSFARNRTEFALKDMPMRKVQQPTLTEGSIYDSKMTVFAKLFVAISWTFTKHLLFINTLIFSPRRSSFPKVAGVERWEIVFIEDQIAAFVLAVIEDQAFFDERLQTHFFTKSMTWASDSQFIGMVSI